MLIVGFYAGLLTLLVLGLAMRVMWLRNTRKVGLGTGDVPELARAVRAHANATEYVPLALLLLIVLAFDQAPDWQLHAFGITLLVARLLHAFGLSRFAGLSFGRVTGVMLTLLVMLAMAALLVCRFAMLHAGAPA